MENRETNFMKSTGANLNAQNIVILGLFVLLLGTGFIIWRMSGTNNQLKKQNNFQKEEIDSLTLKNQQFFKSIKDLEDKTTKLEKEAEELLAERDRLKTSKDSIQRLLNYSRVNEKNSRTKVVQLQKQLKELQAKIADFERRYNELASNSGSNSEELERRIKDLTSERNSLAEENLRLKRELEVIKGTTENRTALFVVGGMRVTPGELKAGKFSASTRSQNTDRLEVRLKLSRAPKPTETLIFKVYDGTNKEVALKPNYRNELNAPVNPTEQRVMLEFSQGRLDRRASGKYSVRVFLTDVNQGLENQEIGMREFELK